MKRIALTQGKFASVDNSDFEELSKFKWYASKAHKTYYANRAKGSKGKQVRIAMHRQILSAPKGSFVDHCNHNGLDNRRSNIRLCTHADNMRNRERNRDNRSGFKGVTWDSHHKKWRANIQVNGKDFYLGYFFCIVKAAKAYDYIAKRYFGEFAYLNFKEK